MKNIIFECSKRKIGFPYFTKLQTFETTTAEMIGCIKNEPYMFDDEF